MLILRDPRCPHVERPSEDSWARDLAATSPGAPAEITILHATLAQRSSRRYGMKKINETGRAALLLQRY
jgi:hypothetical protein